MTNPEVVESELQTVETESVQGVLIEYNPNQFIEQAIKEKAGIDKLERLLALKERYDAGEAEKAYVLAMKKFQSTVPAVPKSKTANINTKDGGSYSYNFAPLDKICQVIQPTLDTCGLAYRWSINSRQNEKNESVIEVTCTVQHIDGHEKSTTMSGYPDNSGKKSLNQQSGSTVTFLKRYTLTSILGIATTDEDTDDKGGPQTKQASNNTANKPETKAGRPPRLISKKQIENIEKLITEVSEADAFKEQELTTKIVGNYGIATLAELPALKYQNCINKLKKTLGEKNAD